MKLKTSGLPRGLSLRGDSYVAFLTHPPNTGHPRGWKERRSIGVVSEKVAIRQREIWMREIQEARYIKKAPKPVADTLPFSEIADAWIEYTREKFPKSLESSESRVKLVKEWFAGRKAASITSDEIETQMDTATRENKWAAATRNNYRCVLSGIFKLAVKKKKLAASPVNDGVSLKKLNNARTRFLSREEADALRVVIADRYPDHLPDFDLALYSGMRRSEQFGRCGKYARTLGLLWSDVHIAQHFITIPESKHGKSRHVILCPEAETALRTLLAHKDGPRVFGDYLAKSIKWFDKAVAAVGLTDVCWHTLRHTWASWLVMSGCDLLALKTLGGWSSLKMVERYAHLAPDHLVTAVNKISNQKRVRTSNQSDTQSNTFAAPLTQPTVQ